MAPKQQNQKSMFKGSTSSSIPNAQTANQAVQVVGSVAEKQTPQVEVTAMGASRPAHISRVDELPAVQWEADTTSELTAYQGKPKHKSKPKKKHGSLQGAMHGDPIGMNGHGSWEHNVNANIQTHGGNHDNTNFAYDSSVPKTNAMGRPSQVENKHHQHHSEYRGGPNRRQSQSRGYNPSHNYGPAHLRRSYGRDSGTIVRPNRAYTGGSQETIHSYWKDSGNGHDNNHHHHHHQENSSNRGTRAGFGNRQQCGEMPVAADAGREYCDPRPMENGYGLQATDNMNMTKGRYELAAPSDSGPGTYVRSVWYPPPPPHPSTLPSQPTMPSPDGIPPAYQSQTFAGLPPFDMTPPFELQPESAERMPPMPAERRGVLVPPPHPSSSVESSFPVVQLQDYPVVGQPDDHYRQISGIQLDPSLTSSNSSNTTIVQDTTPRHLAEGQQGPQIAVLERPGYDQRAPSERFTSLLHSIQTQVYFFTGRFTGATGPMPSPELAIRNLTTIGDMLYRLGIAAIDLKEENNFRAHNLQRLEQDQMHNAIVLRGRTTDNPDLAPVVDGCQPRAAAVMRSVSADAIQSGRHTDHGSSPNLLVATPGSFSADGLNHHGGRSFSQPLARPQYEGYIVSN